MKYAPKSKSGYRMQRFSDGGRLGYEEDPQPGVQTDRQDFQPGLKVDTKDKSKDQSRSKSKVVPKECDERRNYAAKQSSSHSR